MSRGAAGSSAGRYRQSYRRSAGLPPPGLPPPPGPPPVGDSSVSPTISDCSMAWSTTDTLYATRSDVAIDSETPSSKGPRLSMPCSIAGGGRGVLLDDDCLIVRLAGGPDRARLLLLARLCGSACVRRGGGRDSRVVLVVVAVRDPGRVERVLIGSVADVRLLDLGRGPRRLRHDRRVQSRPRSTRCCSTGVGRHSARGRRSWLRWNPPRRRSAAGPRTGRPAHRPAASVRSGRGSCPRAPGRPRQSSSRTGRRTRAGGPFGRCPWRRPAPAAPAGSSR